MRYPTCKKECPDAGVFCDYCEHFQEWVYEMEYEDLYEDVEE